MQGNVTWWFLAKIFVVAISGILLIGLWSRMFKPSAKEREIIMLVWGFIGSVVGVMIFLW